MSSEARARLADLMARHGVDGILKLDNDGTWKAAPTPPDDRNPTLDELSKRVAEYHARRCTLGALG